MDIPRISELAELFVVAVNPPRNIWLLPNFNSDLSATVYFVSIYSKLTPDSPYVYNDGR